MAHARPAGVREFLAAALLKPAPGTTDPAPPERRRVVVALTLVIGAAVLAWSLRIPAGQPLFYPATLLLALVWVGGALASGPVAWRGTEGGRAVAHSLALGLALLVLFLGGAVVVAQVPPLAAPVQNLLEHARRGSLLVVTLITAVNGVCEEFFFRGALFVALPERWRVLGTTLVYTLVTLLSGVPLLGVGALLLGLVVALQRRSSGGVLAPIVTHLVWSLGMLFLLGPTLSTAAHLLG